jgi:fatty-acyl-CoA synthase
MQSKGVARPAPLNDDQSRTRSVACVGIPLPQTEIAIVNPDGERLPERHIGEVLLRSPSLMEGYYNQQEATKEVLRDSWLWTGDLGYIAAGRLYIAGRKKEVLIVGGRNYYPDDLEQAVTEALGVRRSDVVAISYEDTSRATEVVVMFVETSMTNQAEREDLRRRIRQALIDGDFPLSEVVLLRPKTIQTTPNGKVKRVDLKARYLKGEFSHGNEKSQGG